jgi:hypothetical protein
VRGRHAWHITVVLSKAAHSGPSVCLRARAPCPLRVSRPGADRAERAAQGAGMSERAVRAAGSCASASPWVKTGCRDLFFMLKRLASLFRRGTSLRPGICLGTGCVD